MWKSIKNCIIINTVVSSLGYVKSFLYNFNFFIYSAFEVISTIGMVSYMSKINKPSIKSITTNIKNTKNNIENNTTIVTETSNDCVNYQNVLEIMGITTIKCITHSLLITYNQNTYSSSLSLLSIVLFVGESFAFEILFDFIHYSVHKLFHDSPLLYKLLHKKHHEHKNPTAWTTFHIHPLDLILSYSAPLFIATFIVCPTQNNFFIYTTYLTHQEIGGHLGKKMYPTSSFMQFVWLPRTFNVQLYTEDHDLHHKLLNCNYGKRFALFDKIFGTYISGVDYFQNINDLLPQIEKTVDVNDI